MILSDHHYFLTSSADVNEIVQPLAQFFGITSFVYHKNLLDGSEIRLSNQPEWINFFYKNHLYTKSVFEQPPENYVKSRYVWAALNQHKSILNQAKAFNIDHGITFVEPQKDGCEFYFLGTRKDRPEVLTRMLSQLDLLENFLSYFKQRAAGMIKKSQEQRIIIPRKYSLNTLPTFSQTPFDRDAFLSAIDNSKPFSARERQCITLLLSGYNFKMIAQELQISYRTVESHFENIKRKTGCHTKAELIYYLRSNNFSY